MIGKPKKYQDKAVPKPTGAIAPMLPPRSRQARSPATTPTITRSIRHGRDSDDDFSPMIST